MRAECCAGARAASSTVHIKKIFVVRRIVSSVLYCKMKLIMPHGLMALKNIKIYLPITYDFFNKCLSNDNMCIIIFQKIL